MRVVIAPSGALLHVHVNYIQGLPIYVHAAFRMWRTVHEDIDGAAENPTDSEASAVFEGHTRDVYSVICRDGGGSIVSSGYDRMVRLWDVATERQVFHRSNS